jgi:hypothetical protein
MVARTEIVVLGVGVWVGPGGSWRDLGIWDGRVEVVEAHLVCHCRSRAPLL